MDNQISQKQQVKNAIMLGTLCSISYLAVYIARNVLSAVTPKMIEGGFTEAYIGSVSSAYFIFYAVGQLINGLVGDKIKAKYMISFGLFLAGVANSASVFVFEAGTLTTAIYVHALTGFFLSMIYAPMTKVVSENTSLLYATRCSLGYTFASFLGSPSAGLLAAVFSWQSVFFSSAGVLWTMAIVCFVCFSLFEKKGIVKYHQFDSFRQESGGIKSLFERDIVKFTIVSILTGIVRTTVVFWMPTYIAQYLDFTPEKSALIFTAATLVISTTTFIAVFVYEKLGRNMNLTLFLMFSLSFVFFGLLYFIKVPVANIILLILAIMAADAAATMLWSIYCPSLRETGMVSSATGFLDFVSYMAASASSTAFANAVTSIGWGNLILVWAGLMMIGVLISAPAILKKKKL